MEVATRGGRAPKRQCGGTNRKGRACGRGAGWATSHPGYGNCKNHGGSTPSGIKHAALEAARDFSRGMLGAEVDGDPGEVMLEAVRLSRGVTAYYRLQLAGVEGEVSPELISGLERAIVRQGEMAKKALDAGIDERRVKALEAAADRIIAAAEAAIAAVRLTAAQRTIFAREFGARLGELESGGDVEGTASDL